MTERNLETTELHRHLDRFRAGDPEGLDDLIHQVGGRLEGLARKMLRKFHKVRRWADTNDVTQGAVLRLVRTLKRVRPESTERFYGLAAELMRRELLDLSRKYYGPYGIGANHASNPKHSPDSTADGSPALEEPLAPDEATQDLEKWQAFHEAVGRLPAEEREVLGLSFYHEWKYEQIADLLGVSVRTVTRRYATALNQLSIWLKGEFPDQ